MLCIVSNSLFVAAKLVFWVKALLSENFICTSLLKVFLIVSVEKNTLDAIATPAIRKSARINSFPLREEGVFPSFCDFAVDDIVAWTIGGDGSFK